MADLESLRRLAASELFVEVFLAPVGAGGRSVC